MGEFAPHSHTEISLEQASTSFEPYSADELLYLSAEVDIEEPYTTDGSLPEAPLMKFTGEKFITASDYTGIEKVTNYKETTSLENIPLPATDEEIEDFMKIAKGAQRSTGGFLSVVGGGITIGATVETFAAFSDKVNGNEAFPTFAATLGLVLLGIGASNLNDTVDFAPAKEKAQDVMQAVKDRKNAVSTNIAEGYRSTRERVTGNMRSLYDRLKPRPRQMATLYSHEPIRRASDVVYQEYSLPSTYRSSLI